jgi:hypothetical protein
MRCEYPTFRYWEEADEDKSGLVCSSKTVVNVPNRDIDRVISLLASCDGDGRLVAAKNDGDKHGAVSCGVFCNNIL